jgi:hypothetical protein
MAIEAVYFDGETASESKVAVSLEPSGLCFSGDDVPFQMWNLSDLGATNPPRAGKTLRLSHGSHAGARLSIRNDAFMEELLIAAPHLKGGTQPKRALRLVLWIGGGLAIMAGLIYLALHFAPQRLAVLLPDAWSKRVGEQMEGSLVGNARMCQTPDGNKAIAAMLAKLADGNPDIPPLRVRVYDIPIVNAFALPGGYVVLTRGLLREATEPGELAGALAMRWAMWLIIIRSSR